MACGFAAKVVVLVGDDVFLFEAAAGFNAGLIVHDLLLIITLPVEQ